MKNIVNELEQIYKDVCNELGTIIPVEMEKTNIGIDNLKEFLDEMKKNSNRNIIPIEMNRFDRDINKAIESYLLLTKEAKNKTFISKEIGDLLVAFGENMATYSMRTGEQKYFTNGLIALGIAYKVVDWRDVLRILALYWDTHKKKKLSFQFAIDQGDDDFSTTIQQFKARSKSNKSLKCMGYELVGEGEYIQYRSTL